MSQPRAIGQAVGALLGGWVLTLGLVTMAGLAVTTYGDELPVLEVEEEVNRELVGLRTPSLDAITEVGSFAGDTSFVAPAAAVVGLLLRWLLRRWRESLFVAAAVVGHWAVFLTTTMIVDRPRPDVPQLDEAPATSGFPSGHTGAAIALYAALAVVVVRNVTIRWVRLVLSAVLLLIPVLVAAARLYRGMHFPSDLAGSLLSSGLVVLLAYVVVVRSSPEPGRR